MIDEIKDISIYAESKHKHFLSKANHNKREALLCFSFILIFSLSAPLFITLGTSVLWSKIVPSILSVISAVLTSWIQLRKPQKLWSMYRDAQRMIEDELVKYRFEVGNYEALENRDKFLAERIANISLSAHKEWINVVPSPEYLSINKVKE